ncbi:glutathione S-transferase family protein [uncultured Paraglaciecola sp.]|uniref:glutathione S-transferase family protein n=1 Tax=uncultured Paraglaciecola sp. TaxID=1765024 RepID=UPI002638E64D|nr:glutathione S-transferase family protein [uncultured Paraglaciecola sp.]
MITVHHLNKSRSKRVLWLLEELEMPYQRIDYQRNAKTNLAPESLKAIHPLNKAPIIVDGDITLCESSTIIEYILDQDVEKRLRPEKGTKEYYQYLEWSHFAEGSLALPVMFTLFMGMETRSGDQEMDGYIAKEVAVDFGYIESVLADRDYFAGAQFTAADIMMQVMLEIAGILGLLKGRDKTLAYLAKVQERSAYIKAASFG